MPQLEDQWPGIEGVQAPIVIFSVSGLPDVSSSTLLKRLRLRIKQLHEAGGALLIAEASPSFTAALQRTGLADDLGPDMLFPQQDVVFASLDEAVQAGRNLRAARLSA